MLEDSNQTIMEDDSQLIIDDNDQIMVEDNTQLTIENDDQEMIEDDNEKCIVIDTSILKHVINQLKIESGANSVSEVLFKKVNQELFLYTTSQLGPFIRVKLDITEETVNFARNMSQDDDPKEYNSDDEHNDTPNDKNVFVLDISHLKDFLKSSERGHMLIYPTLCKVIFFTMTRETNMIHTSNKVISSEIPLAPFDQEVEKGSKCTIHINNLKSLFGVLKNSKRKDIELKLYITKNHEQNSKQLVIEVIDTIGGPNIFIISDKQNVSTNTEDKISPFDNNSLQKSIQSFEKFIIGTKKRKRVDNSKISLEVIVSFNVFKHVFSNLMDVCEHVELLLCDKFIKTIMPFENGNSICIIPVREIPQ